jgi:cobyrinic acid a,c-diamide synthase
VSKSPRLMIASTKGKSGKTVISLALMLGLRKLGLRVQPFKVGPDFIDPSYHALVTGMPPRNLDSVMFGRETVLRTFAEHAAKADISVIEGMFGLYDSLDGLTERGSSAEIAKTIACPVVLLVDAERANRSLLALVRGFQVFDPAVQIRGLILNNVGTERQEEKIRKAVSAVSPDTEILGSVPRSHLVEESFGYRHLGLTHASERGQDAETVKKIANAVAENLSIDGLKGIAETAADLTPLEAKEVTPHKLEVTVGVIRDKAFSFYYTENLEYLEARAKQVHYFDSSIHSDLPDLDLLYISGGFPEVYAVQLEENMGLKSSIRARHSAGMQIYAECGGLMYLAKSIVDTEGKSHEMVGLIDGIVRMEKKPVGHGYVNLQAAVPNPLTHAKIEVTGHEFHHSRLILDEKPTFAFRVLRGYGIDGNNEGILKKGLLATYTHLHVLHNPSLFDSLLTTAAHSAA